MKNQEYLSNTQSPFPYYIAQRNGKKCNGSVCYICQKRLVFLCLRLKSTFHKRLMIIIIFCRCCFFVLDATKNRRTIDKIRMFEVLCNKVFVLLLGSNFYLSLYQFLLFSGTTLRNVSCQTG